MLDKYPDEAAHRRTHYKALQDDAVKLDVPLARITELSVKRKAIDAEREFYKNKPLSESLQRRLDENEAAFAALADIFRGIETDILFTDCRFRHEREHLMKLWRGAQPGSLDVYMAPRPTDCPAKS